MKKYKPKSQILTINGGSSSIKFAVFTMDKSLVKTLDGQIKRIGLSNPSLEINELEYKQSNELENEHKHEHAYNHKNDDNISSKKRVLAVSAKNHSEAVDTLFSWMEKEIGFDAFSAIGHRIVHGGKLYTKHQPITDKLLEQMKTLIPFDPEHLPIEIALIESFIKKAPHCKQIACFDTAFHESLPNVAKMLPIPRKYYNEGVRRYGFHGISYSFLVEELKKMEKVDKSQEKVIIAHLGNGASMAAVSQGKSIDTSMGFTPTGGFAMSTRSGDLDPGAVAYLEKIEKGDLEKIHRVLNFESGLLGISETSSDMCDLLLKEKEDTRSKEAIDLFCYQIKKWIGSFAAALGGLDTLVFSGGIGENSPDIRARICSGLSFLGIEIDEKSNLANDSLISSSTFPVKVRVIPTNEEKMIAQTVFSFVDACK